jgi:ankyrin repeat protein
MASVPSARALASLPRLVRRHADRVVRVALASLQAGAIAWFWPGRGLPLDDAWIHQVVARTFAQTGTLGYAPGQHGAAATSYLWAALLAPSFVVHAEPSLWALALNTAAALATGQLVFTLLERARPRAATSAEWQVASFAVTLLACASPNVLWFVCSGMEAMPFVALSLAAITAATSSLDGRTRPLVAGIAAAALALLRPEAIPLGALLAAYTLFRSRRVTCTARVAIPWAAAVALYVGSNIAKAGQALPSTLAGRRWLWFATTEGESRSDRALDFLDAWGTRLGSYTFNTSLAVIGVLAAIACYGAVRLVRSRGAERDGLRLVFTWSVFHAAFYALLLPTPGHGGRYQPLTPLLFALCVPIGAAYLIGELARIASLERVRLAWSIAIGVVPCAALAVPVATSLREANALAVAHIQTTEIGAGSFVDTLPDGDVASFDIGGIGFTARRRIYDLGGLSDAATASLLATGRLSKWLEEKRFRWIVLPESAGPALPVFDDYLTRLQLKDSAAFELVPLRVFATPHHRWEPAILATWNAAVMQVVFEVKYREPAPVRDVPLLPEQARKEIPDPARLVHRRERVVVEHMLATLAAWGVDADVKLSADGPGFVPRAEAETESPEVRPQGGRQPEGPMTEGCSLTLGYWGVDVHGCSALGTDRVRAMAYELAGHYIDVGDLGGALSVLPHVLAQAKRHDDPSFLPMLAPLQYPTPGGNRPPTMGASGYGAMLFFGVFLAMALVELAARRNLKLTRLADVVRARERSGTAVAVLLVLCLAPWTYGCRLGDAPMNGGSIFEAASAGDVEIVSRLLAHGAKADARAPDGTLPIHLAARRGHDAAATVLAAAMTRSSIDLPAGPRRRTALHDAAQSGSLETVRVLLGGGADPNKTDSFGETPLHLLARVDPPRAATIATLLLQAGATPNVEDGRGFTPVHAAAVADDVPLLRSLLEDADSRDELVSVRTPAGETALDVALRYGRDRAAEVLVENGATMRGDAWPPLHDAARMDSVARVAALLAMGADASRAFRGMTALDVARANGSSQAIALLRERER